MPKSGGGGPQTHLCPPLLKVGRHVPPPPPFSYALASMIVRPSAQLCHRDNDDDMHTSTFVYFNIDLASRSLGSSPTQPSGRGRELTPLMLQFCVTTACLACDNRCIQTGWCMVSKPEYGDTLTAD